MKIPKHGINLSNYHWKQKKIMATNVSMLKVDKSNNEQKNYKLVINYIIYIQDKHAILMQLHTRESNSYLMNLERKKIHKRKLRDSQQ